MSRDHAVRALFALHLAPVEFDHVVASQVIRRKFWPPKTCEGAATHELRRLTGGRRARILPT